MTHPSNIVHCEGPQDSHALDNVPLQLRNGSLDAKCPVCEGYGQWNSEIDLITFRCKRAICDRCHGFGWVETGDDPVAIPDIEMSPSGHPRWYTRYLPKD